MGTMTDKDRLISAGADSLQHAHDLVSSNPSLSLRHYGELGIIGKAL